MKNSKFTKLIAVVASIVLLVGAAVAITVMADSETVAPVYTDAVGIESLNVSYKAQTELAFAVLDSEAVTLAEGQEREVYLLFFGSDPDASGELDGETLYRTAAARKTASGTVTISGVEHLLFYSNGIKANDLFEDMYVCPVVVIREDGATTYARGYTAKTDEETVYAPRACSVAGYARQRIIEAAQGADISTDQLALYGNILRYANIAANKSGNTAVGAQYVVVSGGYIFGEDGTQIEVSSHPKGYEIVVSAEPKNADGEYFLCWRDLYGTTVAGTRTAALPAHNDIGYVLYEAVYGDASDSPYTSTISFNDMADGDIVALTPPTDASELTSGYIDHEAEIGNILFKNRAWWNLNSETSVYEPVDYAVMKVVDYNGDKEFFVDKTAAKFMPIQTITNTDNVTANGIEFDLKLNSLMATGNGIRISLDSNGHTFTLAVRAYYDSENDKYTVKLGAAAKGQNGALSSTRYFFNDSDDAYFIPANNNDATVSGYELSGLDEEFTVRCIIDDSGLSPIAKAYINDELMFIGAGGQADGSKLSATWTYGYFATAPANYNQDNFNIEVAKLQIDTATVASFSFDNFTFISER